MPQAGYRVASLADELQHVPIVARWMWDSWDRDRGLTLADTMRDVESWCRRDPIPYGVVALASDIPVGCMALLKHDLDDRSDLGPWLACQYVVPVHRGRLVAQQMANVLITRARALKIPTLYMWTEHNAKIYERLGWTKLFETRVWNRLNVTVFNRKV